MKTLYLLGTCVLLSTTLFSCTADEFETDAKKNEIKKDVQASDPPPPGPGDEPINVPPPKK